jgi:predicted nuclease of restriction endonuclease-like (RecB) superfamily
LQEELLVCHEKKLFKNALKLSRKRELKIKQILMNALRVIIENARNNIVHAVNTEMVLAYWHIGREIVEQEQKGKKRAAYGKKTLEDLSCRLSDEFGKGFDFTNLTNMRKFYLAYPILDAVRQELSWTHYRILMRIEKPEARSFYQAECVANNWSARELERQKGSLLYEMLCSYRSENREIGSSGYRSNADVCKLLRPIHEAER